MPVGKSRRVPAVGPVDVRVDAHGEVPALLGEHEAIEGVQAVDPFGDLGSGLAGLHEQLLGLATAIERRLIATC